MIERKRFFEMCQRCAVLPKSAGIAVEVQRELTVRWKDIVFYPVGYELFFDDKGNPIHSAILHDMKANSVVRVNFEEVSTNDGNV
jgi:hypothetical protein